MGDRKLKIIQTVTCINEATGGPAVSVTELASSLARLGHRCRIVALDYPELGEPRAASPAEVTLQRTPFVARRVADWSPKFRRLLSTHASDGSDLIHNHGVWLQPNRYARLAAAKANIPLVISPRGMLEPWARQRGRIKKWIAWQLFESANLHAAVAFHATSEDEARSIRDCGIRAPIAVIPNGVAEPAAREVAAPIDGRFVLFMSRLHPKKGIEMLLDAWSSVRQAHADVRLVIAGPDLTGYRPSLERRARALSLADSVVFHEPLRDDAKSSALRGADVFVLPSFSENFGIVVAEALAHGTPVITTTGTPWSSLKTNRCGWWIEPNVDELTSALSEALALPAAERRAYGERGRALVRDTCSWDAIGANTAEFYRWICDDKCQPSRAPTFLAD